MAARLALESDLPDALSNGEFVLLSLMLSPFRIHCSLRQILYYPGYVPRTDLPCATTVRRLNFH